MQIGTMLKGLFRKRSHAPVHTKGLTIVDDGFIPSDVVSFADLIRGGGRATEGLDSNVVMAPVMWVMRTFPDAIARVETRSDGTTWDWAEGH